MEKNEARNQVRRIQKRFAVMLKQHGFIHTKPTFYCKHEEDYFLIIHIHKYTFTNGFRVHCAFRMIDDIFEAIALNGPNSHEFQCVEKKRMEFNESEKSINECCNEMYDFFKERALSWFEKAKKNKIELIARKRSKDDIINTYELLGIKSKSQNLKYD